MHVASEALDRTSDPPVRIGGSRTDDRVPVLDDAALVPTGSRPWRRT
jgi:hypothetical protein